ncbi:aldo/keto reductase, partial [Candidatus Woesearchaeota archaeon]|nr:aldo/keto reductase [Candidatus Woesearchaeota archaeon]
AQIAINWLISKKNMVTIPKSTDIGHLKENLGAMGWNLSEEDIKILDGTNFESS